MKAARSEDMSGMQMAVGNEDSYINQCLSRMREYQGFGDSVRFIREWLEHVDREIHRNRLQAFATYPVLVNMLIRENQLPIYWEIETIIDRGLPLVSNLASLLQVSKNSIRFLRGKGPLMLGTEWADEVGALLRAIDLLQPEKRPRRWREWHLLRQLWRCCGLAENEHGYLHSSNLEPMKQHMFVSLASMGCEKSAMRLKQLEEEEGFHFSDLKDYFRFVAEWCRSGAGLVGHNHLVLDTVGCRLRDELLTRYSAMQLIRQSQRWHRTYHWDTDNFDQTEAVASGYDWPGLPGLPLSSGGLTAHSLTNALQLQQEGMRLHHCVGEYFKPCVLGESHIVSICGKDGERLSTAEIRLTEHFVPIVVQHRGPCNGDVSADCAAMLTTVCKMLLGETIHLEELQLFHDRHRHEVEAMLDNWAANKALAANMSAVMQTVLPDYAMTLAWLEKRFAEEEGWYRYRNAKIQENLQKLGLDDELTWERVDEYGRSTGEDWYYDSLHYTHSRYFLPEADHA